MLIRSSKHNRGVAIIPLLWVVGILIVGGGIAVITTQNFSSFDNLEHNNLSQTESEDMLAGVKESTDTSATSTESSESDIELNDSEDGGQSNVDIQAPTAPSRTDVEVVEVPKEIAPSVPVEYSQPVEVVEDQTDVLDLTYNEVIIESDALYDGIDLVLTQYLNRRSIATEGIKSCNAIYENKVARAESDAEYLRTTYYESRRGFATNQGALDQIENALEYDLAQIEVELTSCISKYRIDASIQSDTEQIRRDLNSLLTRLTKENSIQTLNQIRTLQNQLLNIADRF